MPLVLASGPRRIHDFPDQPAVGNSGLVVTRFNVNTPNASTSAFDTTTGFLLAAIGRGTIGDFATTTVTDNASNTLSITGSSHNYGSEWPTSGTACFINANATGRAGCVVTDSKPTDTDEVTVIAINILNVTTIEDSSFVYRTSGPTNAGTNITVNKTSVLVSVWSGNDVNGEDDPSPGAGWTRQQYTNFTNSNHVQMALATRVVGAGTYGITWTPNISQGGQVYLFGLN